MDIDIRPEVNILRVLRHLNYKPWFAIAEFVDNAIASYLAWPDEDSAKPATLKVDIKLDNSGDGRLTITDNARGIAEQDFPRAFRAAEVPPDRSGLSEFGMGMKSAASWFASKWSVSTTVVGDTTGRYVEFNLDSITQSRTNRLHVVESPVLASSHFTVVDLQGLHRKPQSSTVSKIKSHLASIYRMFLRSEILELTFNAQQLEFDEVAVLRAPPSSSQSSEPIRWIKDVEFQLIGGQKVSGFVGIRERGSTSQAGLALFRRGRLIVGSHDDPYRPVELFGRSNSYPYQRVFGELVLEGFDVSHTKDGFQWEAEEESFLLHLERELRGGDLDLLSQAEKYRAKTSIDLSASATTALHATAQAFQAALPAVVEDVLDDASGDTPIPAVSDAGTIRELQRTARFIADGRLWLVDIRASLADSEIDWLTLGASEQSQDDTGVPCSRVSVSVALAHPFSLKYLGANGENSELLVALAGSVGLSLALGRLAGAKSYAVLQRLNEISRKITM